MSSSVAILIPTYNEAENIRTIVDRCLVSLPGARILIIDDASPDGTGDLAERLATEYPGQVSVRHRTDKEGLGAAYIDGYTHVLKLWPDCEYFIQMDADLSHDLDYLPAMVNACTNADLAVASRYVQGVSIVNWPIERLLVSWCGTQFARKVTGLPITDCTSGFKCFRREVLEAIDLQRLRSNGYVFQVETSFRAWRAGYRLVDVPIIFHERTRGQSKLHLGIAFEAFRVILRLGLERLFTHTPAPASSFPRARG